MRGEEREAFQLWEVLMRSFTLSGSVPWHHVAPSAAQGEPWFLTLGGFSGSLMVGVL